MKERQATRSPSALVGRQQQVGVPWPCSRTATFTLLDKELIRTLGHFDSSRGLFNYLKEAFTISRGVMICLWELKSHLRKQSSIPHVGK